MLTPEYCQTVIPLYILGISTCSLAVFYLRLCLRDSTKQFGSTYSTGALLFLVLGTGIFTRAINTKTKGQVHVDDIYNDIFNNSKDLTLQEKSRLSAMISQVKYGDAPVSLYSTISSLSQAIAGFGYSNSDSDGRSTSNWKLWSEMRGLPKTNATDQLVDYTCQVFRRIKKNPLGSTNSL